MHPNVRILLSVLVFVVFSVPVSAIETNINIPEVPLMPTRKDCLDLSHKWHEIIKNNYGQWWSCAKGGNHPSGWVFNCEGKQVYTAYSDCHQITLTRCELDKQSDQQYRECNALASEIEQEKQQARDIERKLQQSSDSEKTKPEALRDYSSKHPIETMNIINKELKQLAKISNSDRPGNKIINKIQSEDIKYINKNNKRVFDALEDARIRSNELKSKDDTLPPSKFSSTPISPNSGDNTSEDNNPGVDAKDIGKYCYEKNRGNSNQIRECIRTTGISLNRNLPN